MRKTDGASRRARTSRRQQYGLRESRMALSGGSRPKLGELERVVRQSPASCRREGRGLRDVKLVRTTVSSDRGALSSTGKRWWMAPEYSAYRCAAEVSTEGAPRRCRNPRVPFHQRVGETWDLCAKHLRLETGVIEAALCRCPDDPRELDYWGCWGCRRIIAWLDDQPIAPDCSICDRLAERLRWTHEGPCRYARVSRPSIATSGSRKPGK